MKRLLLFLSLCFICTAAVTEQISINWGADNQLYTTTTCDIGNDIILPTPPTKRGYTFRGWEKDSFNRGTWANWQEVPNDENSYPEDFYGNRTPMTNDYMVVADASQYTPGMTESIIVSKNASSHGIVINGAQRGGPNGKTTYKFDGVTYTIENIGGGNQVNLYADRNVQYNNRLIVTGSKIISSSYYTEIEPKNLYYSKLDNLSGTWRFVYKGIWATDNEVGWKPETQIVE